MLAALGLDQLAEDVYRALVVRGPMPLAELASRVAAPPGPLAGAVRELDRHRLLGYSDDDPPVLQAAPPAVALGALVADHRHRLGQAELTIAQLSAEFDRHGPAEQGSGQLEVLSGAAAIGQRVQQIERTAEQQIRTLVTTTTVAIKGSENSGEEAALARGVRIRVVVEGARLDEAEVRDELQVANDHGVDVRVLDRVPAKLLIADDAVALVPLTSDGDEREPGAMVVYGGALLTLLAELFESVWSRALPLTTDPAAGPPEQLDDTDRRLLSLLLAGFTDAAVGRQLGLSERTVQRRLGTIMRLAGVSSRLQLGWRVRETGWLTEPSDGIDVTDPVSRRRPDPPAG